MNDYSPIEVAVALSLYAYNISPLVRATRLYNHFSGNCAEIHDLIDIMKPARVAYAATELAMPTAQIYTLQALETYGEEAKERVAANMARQ